MDCSQIHQYRGQTKTSKCLKMSGTGNKYKLKRMFFSVKKKIIFQIIVINMTVADLLMCIVYMKTRPWLSYFNPALCHPYYLIIWTCQMCSCLNLVWQEGLTKQEMIVQFYFQVKCRQTHIYPISVALLSDCEPETSSMGICSHMGRVDCTEHCTRQLFAS